MLAHQGRPVAFWVDMRSCSIRCTAVESARLSYQPPVCVVTLRQGTRPVVVTGDRGWRKAGCGLVWESGHVLSNERGAQETPDADTRTHRRATALSCSILETICTHTSANKYICMWLSFSLSQTHTHTGWELESVGITGATPLYVSTTNRPITPPSGNLYYSKLSLMFEFFTCANLVKLAQEFT